MRISDWSSDVCSSDLERAGLRADADDVAIADLADRAAAERLGADVDRAGHLARCARPPAIGDQRHAKSAVLEHAARRGERVQFGPYVGARALEADDDAHVAIEFAGLACVLHLLLTAEQEK